MATTAEIQAERALASAYQTMPVLTDPENAIAVQFVSDGISAFGHVWVTGEILAVDKDSKSYETTLNSLGESWLELDEDGQHARFGRRIFRPYKLDSAQVKAPKKATTKKAAAASKKAAAADEGSEVVSFEDPDAPEGAEHTTAATNPLLRKK